MVRRLETLRTRHGILVSKIDGELARWRPDEVRLSALERTSLALNEQIARLEDRFEQSENA